jgi:hypothetical protein
LAGVAGYTPLMRRTTRACSDGPVDLRLAIAMHIRDHRHVANGLARPRHSHDPMIRMPDALRRRSWAIRGDTTHRKDSTPGASRAKGWQSAVRRPWQQKADTPAM